MEEEEASSALECCRKALKMAHASSPHPEAFRALSTEVRSLLSSLGRMGTMAMSKREEGGTERDMEWMWSNVSRTKVSRYGSEERDLPPPLPLPLGAVCLLPKEDDA